jgi:predicted amidophosphoribosyltransferase
MASIVCPNCGTESSGERVCPGCSLPLVVTCPNCGADAPAEDDTCPACGASLAHGVTDPGN